MLQNTPINQDASHVIMPSDDPLTAVVARPTGAVLAVLTDTIGPSYRTIGTMMVFWRNDDSVGQLSSGCIEKDLSQQAQKARGYGAPMSVRYRQGSPFFDLQLPCGGGLDILLIPDPDPGHISQALQRVAARTECAISFNAQNGSIDIEHARDTGWSGENFVVDVQPKLAFSVFGHGAEQRLRCP